MINESDTKLDLLVEARQPTRSCTWLAQIIYEEFWREGAHRTMNAECSLPALLTKTRESSPSGARGLNSIHYMRSDNGMFIILDALI